VGPEATGEHNASGINGPSPALASNRTEANQDCRGPGWRMDSTACLVRPNAPYVDLPFQLLSAGQSDMEKNNPITRHLKPDLSLVAALPQFLRLRKPRTHARVRHFSFNCNARPRDRLGSGIG